MFSFSRVSFEEGKKSTFEIIAEIISIQFTRLDKIRLRRHADILKISRMFRTFSSASTLRAETSFEAETSEKNLQSKFLKSILHSRLIDLHAIDRQ